MGGDNAVPPMRIGFNYPWGFDEYGFNFGPVFAPPPPDGLPTWKNSVPFRLEQMKRLGVSIIRWFILMNGLNYGRITTDDRGQIQTIQAPRERVPVERFTPTLAGGIRFGGSGWEFDLPDKLDPLVVQHFTLMLRNIRDARIQVIPSLVDFPFFAMPPDRRDAVDPVRNVRPRNPNSGGGRTDVMVIPSKRKQFFDTVLEPLLDASIPFKDQIFAWEVMNEPSWMINAFTLVDNDPRMNRDALVAFLREGLSRIEARPEFAEKSTVGHRFHSDLDSEALIRGLPTGKLPQFHYYGKFFDPDVVPPQKGKTFIGEIAVGANTLFAPRFRANQAAPWPELQGADATDSVFVRLKLLAKLGYKEVFLWPDEKDSDVPGRLDHVKMSPAARQSLQKFTSGP
jgi:hypothetical protein